MKDNGKQTLIRGSVVQISNELATNSAVAGCFATVEEQTDNGALVYIQPVGTRKERASVVYYRATWEEMEFIGMAAWQLGS